MIRTAPVSIRLTPGSQTHRERLAHGIDSILMRKSDVIATIDPSTGDATIVGSNEFHVLRFVEALTFQFQVHVNVGVPRSAYRETPTRAASGDGRFVRQRAGIGQYAHAKIQVHPGEPGEGYVFENEAVDALPDRYVHAIVAGIEHTLGRGVVAGYPVDDVRVVLCGGSYHDVDSSEESFKLAGSMAFHDAATKAAFVVLEPVGRIEIWAPRSAEERIRSDVSARRGRIESQAARHGMSVITARVPLLEMLGYGIDLRAATGGRGTLAVQPAGYQPLDRPDQGPSGDATVGAPLRPPPTPRYSRAEVPEPLPDDEPDDWLPGRRLT